MDHDEQRDHAEEAYNEWLAHGGDDDEPVIQLEDDAADALLERIATPNRPRPCTCRGYDPADPCMHGDTSQGCPRHDSQAGADWDEEQAEVEVDRWRAAAARGRWAEESRR